MGALEFIFKLVVVALFSDGERDRQTIALGWKRASGERRVRARRVFQMVEVEDKLAGLIEAICREAGVEKTASGVGGRLAGEIAKDEEKFWLGGIFEDGLETIGLASEGEFGAARYGLLVSGPDEGGKSNGFGRVVG